MDHSPLGKNVQMRAALPGVGILQTKDLSLQVVQYIETDDKEFEPTDYDKCNSEE
jgi:hypothetical protein